ncbi:Rossmann-like and DUF2520 domain-containing protein [Novosphingobium mathurense]|uniref:Predicted oxidoreductase, contains short-chain dehydrogenase (SDR) and DUF2520 domains n=1 Tax=Novosphingobium mathurense TaxID=428990 RepID=A0A1U6I444_9SPHN|nr:DUF2520 domain-containing protein [Novosphingobium mathurense]SLK02747.1 Predicted oxidoreductase, contains short-chain dehydrogenase (SDR) and DUF2520 domains [Novosphingobium mathurense]
MTGNSANRRIGIIGTGRVAQALALGLGANTLSPPLIWGRTATGREEAVSRIGRQAHASDTMADLVEASDIIAIAVSDDAVASVIEKMATLIPAGHMPFVFHVSGRSGAAVLDPLREKCALTAAIHPAMTFTGNPQEEVTRMTGAYFAITGSSDRAWDMARQIVAELGGVAAEVTEDRRALYHAGLCHAANHLVTLLAGSSHILSAAGVEEPYAMLTPLVRAALENSLARGFDALSGPVLRGDRETIGRHIAALVEHCPQVLPAYRAMALATVDELETEGAPLPLGGVRSELY